MWYKLKATYGAQARRSTVMKILLQEDPAGTLLRKSRYIKRSVYTCDVPNNTWHADGNDKLKPWVRRWILQKSFMASSNKK